MMFFKGWQLLLVTQFINHLRMKKTLFFAIALAFFACSAQPEPEFLNYSQEKLDKGVKLPYSYMSLNLEWTGVTISDPDYTVWGSSPVIGEDGKVHVFCARWPQKNVDPGWRKSSEVAHYVADTPESEYKFVSVVAKGTGVEGDWNQYSPHNPELKKIGDYYVLIYIANTNPERPIHPTNQTIGLFYSKSIYGPWLPAGDKGKILEASTDSTHFTYKSGLGVDNPSITEINGKPVVYFKYTYHGTGKAKYAYATADQIQGPYTMMDEITDNDSYLEDATSFSYNNKHYLVTNDNHGDMSGIFGGAVLWESQSGLDFSLDRAAVAFRTLPNYYTQYDEAKTNKVYGPNAKFERPKVLLIDGKPSYLFAPSGYQVYGKERVECHVLKIKW